ncbi:uncharacterized protein LOC105762258 [Gossypium raimondii]|uniref:uncharacterized protein LOC105762258 n=1 Tax=Gossypium raimondii TaxID=29730 RepID=UPI00227C4EC8|nr:uncharacterized protein LOC105762258 [Gossypium raimondii]
MVPDRLTLQMMEKKPTETFRQYAQRWRDISTQVEPPLTKTEIMVLFINTLKAPFYDKLVGSATKDFADIVISGELIENAVKSGRMEGPESSKRVVPAKKKEAEAHMVGTESPYHQAPPSYLVYAMNNQRPFTLFPPNTMPTQSQPKNDQRPARPIPEKHQFTPIPVLYGELYPKLLEKQLISPHYMAPLKPPYPRWYDPNASCVYHAGNQGHSTENCVAFKKRVQGLIDAGILRFDGVSNVTGNPLPNHTGGNVNAVTDEDSWQAKCDVNEVRTHLKKVWEMMIENGLLCPSSKILKEESTKDQSFCDFHGIEGHDIQSCREVRKLLQDMMDNKEVKVFDSVEGAEEREICASDDQLMAFPYSVDRPLVIYYEAKKEEVSREVKPSLISEVPAHFPYKDNKAVPWNYDVNIIVPEGEKSKVVSEGVSGVEHFTRSGRCYSPKTVEPKKKVAGPSQKGKAPKYEVEDDVETQLEQEDKKAVNEEEAHEFLKFIKHSEYSVVEQLNKQPARISVLSLLLNSEPHRNALLKVLNQAYVVNNVSVEKLDRWANNLNADNFISFSDDEIPPNGRGSVKALHITTNCKGYILPNVIIDNGSALNVMPLATLSRMPVDMSYLRPCYSTVRAFDGTRREVMGKIKIPLKVGPYEDLGSILWAPSSLHQKVKFIMDSRLITVGGEKDIIASISTDAPYIEISEEAVECSFRSLEFINATFVAEGNKIPILKLSRNTGMRIKLTVGKGARARKSLGKYQQWMVRALKPTHQKGRYGLGFKPDIHQRRKQLQKDRERRIARASGQELGWEQLVYPPLLRTFTSAGVMYPGQNNS